MMTVEIRKNGKLLYRLKATNIGSPEKNLGKHMRVYKTSDGREILHNRKKGIVRLAIKMLRGLRAADDKYQAEHSDDQGTPIS